MIHLSNTNAVYRISSHGFDVVQLVQLSRPCWEYFSYRYIWLAFYSIQLIHLQSRGVKSYEVKICETRSNLLAWSFEVRVSLWYCDAQNSQMWSCATGKLETVTYSQYSNDHHVHHWFFQSIPPIITVCAISGDMKTMLFWCLSIFPCCGLEYMMFWLQNCTKNLSWQNNSCG